MKKIDSNSGSLTFFVVANGKMVVLNLFFIVSSLDSNPVIYAPNAIEWLLSTVGTIYWKR